MTFHAGNHGEVEVGIIAEDFCAIDTDGLALPSFQNERFHGITL
jgi:hypothetical protein